MSGPSGFDRHQIDAEEVILGERAQIHPTAIITGWKGTARKVVIAADAVIGENVRIMTTEFSIGRYSKFNAGAYVYGRGGCSIGRNCWFGGNTLLDCEGGLTIEDNCTIGRDTKIWSHFLGGDWVRGGRFNDYSPRLIRTDTWIGCDCVVTTDTPKDSMYPPMTKVEFGTRSMRQFDDIGLEDKHRRLAALKAEFLELHPFDLSDLDHFDPETNTYEERNTLAEVAFMKAMISRLRMLPK